MCVLQKKIGLKQNTLIFNIYKQALFYFLAFNYIFSGFV